MAAAVFSVVVRDWFLDRFSGRGRGWYQESVQGQAADHGARLVALREMACGDRSVDPDDTADPEDSGGSADPAVVDPDTADLADTVAPVRPETCEDRVSLGTIGVVVLEKSVATAATPTQHAHQGAVVASVVWHHPQNCVHGWGLMSGVDTRQATLHWMAGAWTPGE